jgi:DNA-binding MarR family transcriptional regulator
LSPLLRRLESAGLVTRVRAAEDERRVTIHLTAAGRDLEERAADVPAALAAHLVDEPTQYEVARASLKALADRLESARTATR